MTQEIFQKMLRLMAATWPDRSPTADTATAYWIALNHLDDEEFEHATMRCLQECTFFPRPAEILSRVSTSRPGALQPAWLNDPVQVRRMEALQERGPIVQRLCEREREELDHDQAAIRRLDAGT